MFRTTEFEYNCVSAAGLGAGVPVKTIPVGVGFEDCVAFREGDAAAEAAN